jgi:hypothetical protein
MAYNSLFDQLAAKEEVEPLERTVRHSLDLSFASYALLHHTPSNIRIYEMLEGLSSLEGDSVDTLTKRIWYPAKILACAMHHKITFFNQGQYIPDATDLAIKMYAQEATKEEILALRDRFCSQGYRQAGYFGLDFIPAHKCKDQRTSSAMDPSYCKSSAESLTQVDDDILFIALGNGGIAPGLDVFLRFLENGSDSNFYPVRFSMEKQGDLVPQLTDCEIRYLRDLIQGKSLVIFDEDTSSGQTLDDAHTFFTDAIFPGIEDVILLTAENGVLSLDDLKCNSGADLNSSADSVYQC